MRPDAMSTVQSMAEEVNERLNSYPEALHPFLTEFFFTQQMILKVNWRTGHPDWRYACYQDLLLDLGELKRATLFVPGEVAEFETMEVQQCYSNAYHAAMDLGYQYVEGLAQTDLMQVRHAWLEDEHGRIIDPTWAHLPLPADFPVTYFGIKFSTTFVMANAMRTGWLSIIDQDWREDHALLKHGLVTDAAGIVTSRGATT